MTPGSAGAVCYDTSGLHISSELYRNADANAGASSSAWVIYSRPAANRERVIGPPRQTRAASGGGPAAVKASLATTPIDVKRMCSTNAARFHKGGNSIQMLKARGSLL